MGESVNFQECSFCGKHKTVVQKLIVGDSTAICNDCVDLCVDILKDEKVKNFSADDKILNPVLLKEYLDEYIVGQEEAKISLSVAVAQHLKRMNFPSDEIRIEKTNVFKYIVL